MARSPIEMLIDDACGVDKPRDNSTGDDMEISQVLGELADAATAWAVERGDTRIDDIYNCAMRLRELGWVEMVEE